MVIIRLYIVTVLQSCTYAQMVIIWLSYSISHIPGIYAGLSYEDTEAGVMYTFNTSSGKLIQIASLVDNSSIVVEHRDQEYPVLFTHSNGKRLNVTYTNSGLISYVDLLDEENNVEKTRLASHICAWNSCSYFVQLM